MKLLILAASNYHMGKIKVKGKHQPAIIKALILISLAVALHIFSLFPGAVEKYYSLLLYPVISGSFRFITGWLPFSLGDMLYTLAGCWVLVRLFKSVKAILQRKVTKQSFLSSLRRTFLIGVWIYVLFNLLWGLNYNRQGIAHQLHLTPAPYNKEELKTLTVALVDNVNSTRRALGDSLVAYPAPGIVFENAVLAYTAAEKKYPFLEYDVPAVKGSLYSFVNSYMGILGYYNPFTGEAQVNTKLPSFLLPFTACHEIGHQLGYATEDEANFAGYLAATASGEKSFRYSAGFELFMYANRQLYIYDTVAARQNIANLDTLVKKDIRTYRQFLAAHQNPIEPYITDLYGNYLQANNQPAGIETYDEVVSWLIAYRKKYGEKVPAITGE